MSLDDEHLAALQTERAYLVANGKLDRASQVDDQIDAVRARSAATEGPETTAQPAPSEKAVNPKPAAKGRRKPPPDAES
jgi:hypothetical protein